MQIRLIIGLGNYGDEYKNTRHNVGFWVLDRIASTYKVCFREEKKFYADMTRFSYNNQEVILLKPLTYMNLSGRSVLSVMSFYKIKPSEIIVVHDELDFTCGVVKVKNGGGCGGHNGLKSIDSVIGNNYLRLRVGINHPLDKNLVSYYVLKPPTLVERQSIELAIDKIILNIKDLLYGYIEKFTKSINTK